MQDYSKNWTTVLEFIIIHLGVKNIKKQEEDIKNIEQERLQRFVKDNKRTKNYKNNEINTFPIVRSFLFL